MTAGLLDEGMGSDEQEIIEMINLIIDVDQRKNIALHRQYIRPIFIENLTDESKQASGIDETLLFSSELDLNAALRKFDTFLRDRYLHPDYGVNLTLVCVNCLHLRQCLHPESVKKSTIHLPSYYWSYFNLRHEFEHMYRTIECYDLNTMLEKLSISPIDETDYCMRNVRHMELIVYQMLNDGHRFEKPEYIMANLQRGICSLEDNIEESTVIRARGLPWQCTDQDVARFFRGLDIEKGGVALCLSSQGRRNGEALVRFATAEHRELALHRHKHHIGQRYIEVYKASGRDFLNVAGGKYFFNFFFLYVFT
jgi:epithelial splicing regulatory protein 1/2